MPEMTVAQLKAEIKKEIMAEVQHGFSELKALLNELEKLHRIDEGLNAKGQHTRTYKKS
jgi:hypothetical protein